jgi:hypothetical protein
VSLAVADLDASLQPMGGIGADEDPGLIELLAEVEKKRHLVGSAFGERAEQAMPVVVHEAVRGRAPEVGSAHRGHEQIVAVQLDTFRSRRPRSLVPSQFVHGRTLRQARQPHPTDRAE